MSVEARMPRSRASGSAARCACTVAVHRHAAQHVDIGNAALKVIRHCLPGISHAFEKCRAAFPALMNLSLSLASGSAADSNVFERSAEARHAMPFEMGEHQHRVIAIQMRSHRHGLEPTAARNRPWRSAVFIQDVNGRESPAVCNERFTMSGRCSPRPP